MLSNFSINFLPKIGIEIANLNLQNLLDDGSLKDELVKLLSEHHLLVLKNQQLDEEQLIKVSQIFGEPVQALVPTNRLEKYPLITRHGNTKNSDYGKGIASEHVFHSDSYFTNDPTKVTLFYCLRAPKIGGDTHFVNMCTAYDSLGKETKDFIAHKKVYYKNAYINQPPVLHPLVRIDPLTRKALYVNIHRALGIDGLPEDEALSLIERLYKHATSSEFMYQHQWENGDLLIWNNPTTMHCATSTPDSEERLLYRVLTKGDLPVL